MPPEKAATAVQYDDLTGGDVGGSGAKAARRPPTRLSIRLVRRWSVWRRKKRQSARSLARRRVEEHLQSIQILYNYYATKSPRHEGGTETFTFT